MRKILLETENTILEIEDDILIANFKRNYIDLPFAQKALKDRLIASEGKAFLLIINVKNIKKSTIEARDFLASPKGCEGVIAAAILIDTPFSRMLANFFIYFNKPFIPTRVFTNEEEAKKWLSQFKKE